MQMKKSLLTMLALLSMGSSAFAQGTINVPTVTRNVEGELTGVKEVSVVASRQGTVKIELQNNADYRDLQFDITLPEGITLADAENGGTVKIATDHAVGFATQTETGAVRFVLYSENAAKLSNAILLEIPVAVAESFTGTQPATLTKVLTSNDAAESIEIANANFNVRAVLLGDVNDSGTVTNADQVAIVMYLLDEPSTPFVFEAADMEYNAAKPNEITNADAISLADKLLSTSAKAFMGEDVESDVETEIEPD